jgi:hypothetical protein
VVKPLYDGAEFPLKIVIGYLKAIGFKVLRHVSLPEVSGVRDHNRAQYCRV